MDTDENIDLSTEENNIFVSLPPLIDSSIDSTSEIQSMKNNCSFKLHIKSPNTFSQIASTDEEPCSIPNVFSSSLSTNLTPSKDNLPGTDMNNNESTGHLDKTTLTKKESFGLLNSLPGAAVSASLDINQHIFDSASENAQTQELRTKSSCKIVPEVIIQNPFEDFQMEQSQDSADNADSQSMNKYRKALSSDPNINADPNETVNSSPMRTSSLLDVNGDKNNVGSKQQRKSDITAASSVLHQSAQSKEHEVTPVNFLQIERDENNNVSIAETIYSNYPAISDRHQRSPSLRELLTNFNLDVSTTVYSKSVSSDHQSSQPIQNSKIQNPQPASIAQSTVQQKKHVDPDLASPVKYSKGLLEILYVSKTHEKKKVSQNHRTEKDACSQRSSSSDDCLKRNKNDFDTIPPSTSGSQSEGYNASNFESTVETSTSQRWFDSNDNVIDVSTTQRDECMTLIQGKKVPSSDAPSNLQDTDASLSRSRVENVMTSISITRGSNHNTLELQFSRLSNTHPRSVKSSEKSRLQSPSRSPSSILDKSTSLPDCHRISRSPSLSSNTRKQGRSLPEPPKLRHLTISSSSTSAITHTNTTAPTWANMGPRLSSTHNLGNSDTNPSAFQCQTAMTSNLQSPTAQVRQINPNAHPPFRSFGNNPYSGQIRLNYIGVNNTNFPPRNPVMDLVRNPRQNVPERWNNHRSFTQQNRISGITGIQSIRAFPRQVPPNMQFQRPMGPMVQPRSVVSRPVNNVYIQQQPNAIQNHEVYSFLSNNINSFPQNAPPFQRNNGNSFGGSYSNWQVPSSNSSFAFAGENGSSFQNGIGYQNTNARYPTMEANRQDMNGFPNAQQYTTYQPVQINNQVSPENGQQDPRQSSMAAGEMYSPNSGTDINMNIPTLPKSTIPYPPRYQINVSVTKNGIVLTWDVESINVLNPQTVHHYELFASQHSDTPNPDLTAWEKIEDIEALPLPMACTLTQVLPNSAYHFALLGVDIYGRRGPISNPCTIKLR